MNPQTKAVFCKFSTFVCFCFVIIQLFSLLINNCDSFLEFFTRLGGCYKNLDSTRPYPTPSVDVSASLVCRCGV